MPSKSKSQRRTAGLAKACKSGKVSGSACNYGAVKQMGKMSSDELDKFAKTKEKKLPEKVPESLSFKEWMSFNGN